MLIITVGLDENPIHKGWVVLRREIGGTDSQDSIIHSFIHPSILLWGFKENVSRESACYVY